MCFERQNSLVTKMTLPENEVGKANILTRSKAFQKLTKEVFRVCDQDKTGKLSKAELHTGILLVHLNLAKYAGAAACYPPSRAAIDNLFDACDSDKSGFIDEKEFESILVRCCAQITSRILVYFTVIVFLVPYVARAVITVLTTCDQWLELKLAEQVGFFAFVEKILTFGQLAENVVATTLFFLVVPYLFDSIDRLASAKEEKVSSTIPENTKKD